MYDIDCWHQLQQLAIAIALRVSFYEYHFIFYKYCLWAKRLPGKYPWREEARERTEVAEKKNLLYVEDQPVSVGIPPSCIPHTKA